MTDAALSRPCSVRPHLHMSPPIRELGGTLLCAVCVEATDPEKVDPVPSPACLGTRSARRYSVIFWSSIESRWTWVQAGLVVASSRGTWCWGPCDILVKRLDLTTSITSHTQSTGILRLFVMDVPDAFARGLERPSSPPDARTRGGLLAPRAALEGGPSASYRAAGRSKRSCSYGHGQRCAPPTRG